MLRCEAEVGMSVRINNPIRKEHGISGYIKSFDRSFDMVWVRLFDKCNNPVNLLCEYRELEHVVP